MRTTEILLVRHCESTGQDPEAPLSEAGFRQAEALAQQLHGERIEHVISSPFLRARQTVAPLAQRRGLAVHLDPRLAERKLADPPIPNWRDFVSASFDDLDSHAPGGESGRATLTRGWAAISERLTADHDRTLIVSHGQLLALILHSLDASFGYAGWESLRNPDVIRLWRAPDGQLRFERWACR